MAFVTHTGNNGLLEAIHYRVPMVGLPIYMNQEDNLSRLVEKGIAVGVHKWSDSDEIYQASFRIALFHWVDAWTSVPFHVLM